MYLKFKNITYIMELIEKEIDINIRIKIKNNKISRFYYLEENNMIKKELNDKYIPLLNDFILMIDKNHYEITDKDFKNKISQIKKEKDDKIQNLENDIQKISIDKKNIIQNLKNNIENIVKQKTDFIIEKEKIENEKRLIKILNKKDEELMNEKYKKNEEYQNIQNQLDIEKYKTKELNNKIKYYEEKEINFYNKIIDNNRLDNKKIGEIGEFNSLKLIEKFYKNDKNTRFKYIANCYKQGDISLFLNEKYKGCIDIKNKTIERKTKNSKKVINQTEIDKIKNDIDNNKCHFGILISMGDQKFVNKYKNFECIKTKKNNLLFFLRNIEENPNDLFICIEIIRNILETNNTLIINNDINIILKNINIFYDLLKSNHENINNLKNNVNNIKNNILSIEENNKKLIKKIKDIINMNLKDTEKKVEVIEKNTYKEPVILNIIEDINNKYHCKVCNCYIQNEKYKIKRHNLSKKHLEKV